MARERTFMPQSTAGLIRYFDATKETIKLKPEHVLGACIAVILLEIMVKMFF